MKNSSDTIGNQTRDLPAFSSLPQPTAPTRVPSLILYFTNFILPSPANCLSVCPSVPFILLTVTDYFPHVFFVVVSFLILSHFANSTSTG